ncbi:MAG: hypothetical protein ABI538_04590 [Pseudoxanthomonas sp.]
MRYAAVSDIHKQVMLDIDSELAYWRLHYTHSAFHRTQRPFEDYVCTLKFGYDMYLLNHGDDLEKLLPAMRGRYEATATMRDDLGWPLTEAVIRETWKRMRPEQDQRNDRLRPGAVVSRSANWSQSQYQSA